MRSVWGALVLAALAFPQNLPAARPDVDYSVGIAIAIEPDKDFSTSRQMLVRVTPEGKLGMTTPDRTTEVEVAPRVSFYWDTNGDFRRTSVELGNKLSSGLASISSRPTVVIGDDGVSWLVIPSTLLPKVNGFSPSSVPGVVDDTRRMLSLVDIPAAAERQERLLASESGLRPKSDNLALCLGEPTLPLSSRSVRFQKATSYKLREPELRWKEGRQTRDYETFLRAWRRFVAENPEQVQSGL